MNDLTIGNLGASYMNMDDYRKSSVSKAQDANFAYLLERAFAFQGSEGTGTENTDDTRLESADKAPSSPKTKVDKNDKLYQLLLELETFLVKNLLTSMRNTVQKSGLVDDSYAGKMYEDMLYDEYAKDFAKNANFGLAEQAYLQYKDSGYRISPNTLM